MELEQVLKTVGLGEKAAKVYLASLALGPDTAFHIAKSCGLKRTTVHFVLDQLKNEGFVSIRQTPKVTIYYPLQPHKMLTRLQEKEALLAKSLPSLEAIYKTQAHRPKVEIFEGREGLKSIYRETEKYLTKPEGVLYYGSFSHFFGDEFSDFYEWWVVEVKDKRCKVREILERHEAVGTGYLNKIQENANPNHLIHLLPAGVHFTENDNFIMGNKVAIFSSQKELFVVVIESEAIAQSYRAFFELAWRGSKPVSMKKKAKVK